MRRRRPRRAHANLIGTVGPGALVEGDGAARTARRCRHDPPAGAEHVHPSRPGDPRPSE